MVLYYMSLRGWMHLGHGEWIIRFPGVLLSTGNSACDLFDWIAALRPANRYHCGVINRHASIPSNARATGTLVSSRHSSGFAVVSAAYTTGREAPPVSAMGYAVLSAAAVYSHVFSLFVVAAQLCSILVLPKCRVPWKPLAVFLTVLAGLLVLSGWFALTHASTTHVEWVQDLSVQQTLGVLYALTLSKARSLSISCCGALLDTPGIDNPAQLAGHTRSCSLGWWCLLHSRLRLRCAIR